VILSQSKEISLLILPSVQTIQGASGISYERGPSRPVRPAGHGPSVRRKYPSVRCHVLTSVSSLYLPLRPRTPTHFAIEWPVAARWVLCEGRRVRREVSARGRAVGLPTLRSRGQTFCERRDGEKARRQSSSSSVSEAWARPQRGQRSGGFGRAARTAVGAVAPRRWRKAEKEKAE
jgi:hypothetical protein